MYKPDINTNDDRIDLFGTITLQPQINKTNAATLPLDSAFAKSVIVATTFDTELIDSTSSRINKSASFYLYTSWVARHLKNSSTTNTEKIYFITPQKLGITDSSNIILFLLPLKNHELLKKYGTIQWQWLSNAPVLFNNINIINNTLSSILGI